MKKQVNVGTAKAKQAKSAKPVKIEHLTYRNSEAVRAANLWNCRGSDLIVCKGVTLKAGSIVVGKHGYCVAALSVPDCKAVIVPFKANGKALIVATGKTVPAMWHKTGDYAAIMDGNRLRWGRAHSNEKGNTKLAKIA